MSNATLTELEDRLANAERELENTRAQLRALEAPRSNRIRDAVVGVLGLSVVFAVTSAYDTYAEDALQVLTVKAPFKVMDSSGTKVLLQLEDLGSGSMAFSIGSDTMGPHAGGVQLIVPSSGNGTVKVFGKTGVLGVGMTAAASGNRVSLFTADGTKGVVDLKTEESGGKVRVFPAAGGTAAAELTAEASGGAVTIYNGKATPVAMMSAPSEKGYLEINDSAGKRMVEAGSRDGRGSVLASPWEVSMDPHGDPSVLRGGRP